MYNIESMMYDAARGHVIMILIKETDETEFGRVHRFRNNREIAVLKGTQFTYTRRGRFLVGKLVGNPYIYPEFFAGVGDWRFEDWIAAGIRGNVRGCL